MTAFPISCDVELADIQQAFIDGAREARRNPTAGDDVFVRAADAYVKQVCLLKSEAGRG